MPRVSAWSARARARTILYRPNVAGRVWRTGCLQKARESLRTLTDMTFLKFAAIYVSFVPLFLFCLAPSCFLFPLAAVFAVSLFYPVSSFSCCFSSPSPGSVSTSRFPRSFYLAPSLRHIDSLPLERRRNKTWQSREKEIFFSFPVARRIVLLFADSVFAARPNHCKCARVILEIENWIIARRRPMVVPRVVRRGSSTSLSELFLTIAIRTNRHEGAKKARLLLLRS